MLVELRKNQQITIPAKLAKMAGVAEGDQFEAFVRDGCICLMPVVVYPKKEMERIAALLKEAETDRAEGRTKTYDSVEEMFKDFELFKESGDSM